MALQILALLISILVPILILWLLIRKPSDGKLQLPPGPRALPVIGHLHLLMALRDLPLYRAFSSLAKLHGPLIYLRLGSIHTVIASSPEMARQILLTQDHIFASRPQTAFATHMLFNRSDISFAPYGPYWKLLRRLCITDLFHKKRIDASRPTRAEAVSELLQRVLDVRRHSHEHEGSFQIRDHLQATAADIISRITLSKAWSYGSDIFVVMENFFHMVGVPHLGDLFPWMGSWVDPQRNVPRMKAVGRKLRATFLKVIEERRAEMTDGDKDLLDDLLALSQAGNSNEFGITLTDDNIMAVLVDMFLGGIDSASSLVEWVLAELLANTAIMNKAQEEIDRVVGKDRLVEESDLSNLLYLQAIVKESLRIHPVGPLLAPHQSMQECYIDGYYIPAKTTCFVNVWEIGRDPKVWKDPNRFLPERFLESNIDDGLQHVGHNFQYIPFGAGRRMCPGRHLGLLNAQLMLASLLQAFQWSLPSFAHGNVDMREKYTITSTLAHPLVVIATPRLPTHLVFRDNHQGQDSRS